MRIFLPLRSKVLSKQEGTTFCWDACFLNIFLNLNQLPAAKKKKIQKAFGPSYFDSSLGSLNDAPYGSH